MDDIKVAEYFMWFVLIVWLIAWLGEERSLKEWLKLFLLTLVFLLIIAAVFLAAARNLWR